MPLLGPGEATILSEPTESGASRDGILTLTSWRVIFEGEAKQGLVTQIVRGKRLVTLVDLRLDQLSNVHRDKPLLGRSTLRIEGLGKNFTFKVRDADQWTNAIMRARQSVPAPAPYASPYGAHAAPVIVNVAAPQAVAPQVYLHCRHCGALQPTGGPAGQSVHCTSCGATL